MKIVVCVKYVPDATADRSFSADSTVDRAGVDGVLSELDEYAVEAALQLREAGDAEITIMTLGPESARAAILKSLQMGADAGVHISTTRSTAPMPSARPSSSPRPWSAPASTWSSVGMASTDGSMSVVPAMLAERLSLPQVTFASEVTVEGTTVRARRDGDTATETIEATLPLVLSVTDQANEPRYPSFKGIMAAKKKPVETWSLADLGLSPDDVGLSAAWTAVEAVAARPPRSAGTVVTDDGTGADQLVDFLAAGKFI